MNAPARGPSSLRPSQLGQTTKTTCPYCGVGCGVLAQSSGDGLVQISGDPTHPANFGRLCSKGINLGETLGSKGRVCTPRIGEERASWAAALTKAARGLAQVVNEHGPEAVAFYVSGQLLTEDYYVANKLMKGFIGGANIDANSRLCMASAVVGYQRALGSDTVPTSYEDLESADLVVLVGSNMAWCHPVLFQRLLAARKADPNKRLVVIDPRRTSTSEEADLHLALAPGSDVTLFCGLLDHLRRHGVVDYDFLESSAMGFGPTFRAARESAPSLAIVARSCGLSEEDLLRFYELFAESQRTVSAYSMGVNQSSDGSDKVSAIINCHLATGRIGKPGSGPFSLTGQPNAMGGREVGALANLLAAHLVLGDEEDTDTLRRFWKSDTIAQRPGRKAVDMFADIASGKIKAIWIMATNPVVSMPNSLLVRKALERCPLVIVSEAFEDADTLEYADIVFPARAWGEKEGTVTNSERCISRTRAFLEPTGDAMPDWWIVCEVAKGMGFASAFSFESSADVFDEHARLSAFENQAKDKRRRSFNLRGLVGLRAQEYEELTPRRWPVAPPGEADDEVFSDGRFDTPGRRARLVAVRPRPPARPCSSAYPLVLNTGRVRDHWHTMTRTSRSPTLSAHSAEPLAELHPDNAREAGIVHNELLRLESPRGELIVRAQVSTWQRPGSVFVPMHWSRSLAKTAGVNEVVHDEVCELSGQPDFKRSPVRVSPFEARWHGFVLSRRELELAEFSEKFPADYCVKVRGDEHWRYELAGASSLSDPAASARELLCTRSPEVEWVEYANPKRGRYRGIRMVDGELESCFFASPDIRLPSREWLGEQFRACSSDEQPGADRSSLLAGRPGTGAVLDGSLICSCLKVSMGRLVDGIHRQGWRTCEDVGQATGAGTGCGSCLSEIRALLRETRGEESPGRAAKRGEDSAAALSPGPTELLSLRRHGGRG